jgi:hypothetical protein
MKEVSCKCKAALRRFRKGGAAGAGAAAAAKAGAGGEGAGGRRSSRRRQEEEQQAAATATGGAQELMRKQGRDCDILGVKFGNLLDCGRKNLVPLHYWIQLWKLNGMNGFC